MTGFKVLSILVKANTLDEPSGTKMLAVLKNRFFLSANSRDLWIDFVQESMFSR
jgi:hypothetical protein